jgi:SprT protein
VRIAKCSLVGAVSEHAETGGRQTRRELGDGLSMTDRHPPIHRVREDENQDPMTGESMTDETIAIPSPTEQAAARTGALLREAEAWLRLAMPRVEIRFDLRGTSAGQARMRNGSSPIIRYNATLLRLHPTEFIVETVPHEVAHVVAFVKHGPRIRPHGPEWQAVMRHFGVEPSRCHRYDVSRLRTRSLQRFLYRCSCGTHEISSIRHNRICREGTVYLCRRCRQPLSHEIDLRG